MGEIIDNTTIGEEFLSEILFFEIKLSVLSGNMQPLNEFINKFSKYADWDYTDELVERLKSLCRFLIDSHQYEFVTEILKNSYIIGIFDDEDTNSECLINYAIRNMKDEDICAMLRGVDFKGNINPFYFFKHTAPSVIAANYKKFKTLKLLFEIGLATEQHGYGEISLLQQAARKEDYELAEFALSLNQDINEPCYLNVTFGFNMSPLEIAVDNNDFKMCDFLIEHGAYKPFSNEKTQRIPLYAHTKAMIQYILDNKEVRPCRQYLKAVRKQPATFNIFFCSEKNKEAFSSSVYVAENLKSHKMNPLIICGRSWSGKSILLSGIQERVKEIDISKMYLLIDGKCLAKIDDDGEFSPNFANMLDILLLDDCNCLIENSKLRKKLINLMSDFVSKNKHIVLAYDLDHDGTDVFKREIEERFPNAQFCYTSY